MQIQNGKSAVYYPVYTDDFKPVANWFTKSSFTHHLHVNALELIINRLETVFSKPTTLLVSNRFLISFSRLYTQV